MKNIFMCIGVSICIPAITSGADIDPLMSISIPTANTTMIPDAETLCTRFAANEKTALFAQSELPKKIGGKKLSPAAVRMWVSVEVAACMSREPNKKAITDLLLLTIYKE